MSDKVMIQSGFNRIFHWLMFLSIMLLLISGFYIHNPFNLGVLLDMGTNVLVQLAAGFFASAVFAGWVYYYLVTGSYTDVWFRIQDIADFRGLMKYYFFLEEKPPVHGKYNAGQRLIFTSWFFVFIFMFLTGLALYMMNYNNIIPFGIIPQKIRLYHFLGALWFLGTVPLHIYLALTEDPAKLQAIFTGWIRKKF